METMKRKWGKPITSVQVFTPQEYVAGCGPGGEGYIQMEGDCGVGIARSPYAADLANCGPGTSKTVEVTLVGQTAQYEWYPCDFTHDPISIAELKAGTFNISEISILSPDGYKVLNGTELAGYYGWMSDNPRGMHIFYIASLDNIPEEYGKTPMS